MTDHEGYADWQSLELAIKDAAKKAAQQAGPGVSAASIDAQIRQARFDRFLTRVFAHGEQTDWLLKGGMSMLARVPRSRTTKDMDLAAQHATNLAEAEKALTELVDVDLGDHLTFRIIDSVYQIAPFNTAMGYDLVHDARRAASRTPTARDAAAYFHHGAGAPGRPAVAGSGDAGQRRRRD
ncbi:nucleotidyl transferase AbiEii/AbiGii toxin family protein [Kribbella sindirgiensis]|uniref:nucleotidyl transferase AbiEii/AbiGii toxin family protein n=1 Tax=Kribbella sindirgiensis TaxID=1124744 RepID=UPI001EDF3C3C|nr:nucleotidyl transferase AbiEii/AbiGii toxin family protein [Kribbella sindirgiensis]